MTVVGGLRSRAGLVIGGAFFALLPYLIEKIPGFEDLLAKIPAPVDLTPELATLDHRPAAAAAQPDPVPRRHRPADPPDRSAGWPATASTSTTAG